VTAGLLDGNVLIALSAGEHVHHEATRAWWLASSERFATTPITQGTLVRYVLRVGGSTQFALEALDGLMRNERHEFWPDDLPFSRQTLRGVMGHRQVTDAYLAATARLHGGRLVTLDAGLAAVHSDVVELIPV
jgi:uncharacterized protein